ATILDYAGLEPMPGMTVAESLRPLLEAKPTNWRDYVVAESNSAGGPHRAVCMRDYKAVLNQDGSASLHNLKADPLEMQDLSEDPKHAEVLRRARDFHNDYVDRIVLHPKLRSFGKV
ncbi:MAG: sulfatase/phosphatase domain-containing protein, partial [Planctomycetota bacterium]